jgi:hypothetical protein
VDLTPEGHLYRAGYLESLGVSLTDRYQRLGDLNDLDAAVQRKQESVDLTPEDHPDRAQRLQNLAVSLTYKYQKLGRQEDLEVIHSHYTDSFKEGTSNPEYAWDAALTWASFCEEFHLSSCLTAYTAAFHLLPEILWIGNSINVRHNAIHRLEIGEATSSATKTCINFSNLSLAVEIMEQGLGITFQQMLQLRTDLDGLAPDQANKLKILSSELYSGVSHNPRHVAIKRQDLLKDIRAQPGLEYFLLPKPYKTLCHASQGGPVVMLNSHQEHCDGIILLNPTSDPVHVPLPNVTIDQLKSQQKALRELLGRCNVRTRGESESTRLFGHRELFGLKPSEESFAELLTWLYVHVVAPVYQVLELVSIQLPF